MENDEQNNADLSQQGIALVRIALHVLGNQSAIFIAMMMQFSLAIWTAYDPDPLRLWLIGLFGGTVFLPVLFRMGSKSRVGGN